VVLKATTIEHNVFDALFHGSLRNKRAHPPCNLGLGQLGAGLYDRGLDCTGGRQRVLAIIIYDLRVDVLETAVDGQSRTVARPAYFTPHALMADFSH
jgi:hypothetical protein